MINKNSSENEFLNRKNKTRQHNPYSSRCLIKAIKKNKLRKSSECKSARHRRYSTPNKEKKDKKVQISDKSLNNHSDKKINNVLLKSWSKFDNKKEKTSNYKKERKAQKKIIEKNKIYKIMQKVDEEDY